MSKRMTDEERECARNFAFYDDTPVEPEAPAEKETEDPEKRDELVIVE